MGYQSSKFGFKLKIKLWQYLPIDHLSTLFSIIAAISTLSALLSFILSHFFTRELHNGCLLFNTYRLFLVPLWRKNSGGWSIVSKKMLLLSMGLITRLQSVAVASLQIKRNTFSQMMMLVALFLFMYMYLS